jgi:NAD(P)-dependent dehydrogenase (short-subunit alcohol dehydrogenase family)
MPEKPIASDITLPMAGKICLVTGATAGIGKVTAHALAQQGASVVLVGRNLEKGEAVVGQIKKQTGNSAVEFMVADLSSQQQIRHLAERFQAKYRQLHVLVNNAGAVFFSRWESVDGLEMTFALNHLGYFLLTNLLLDMLKASTPARVVNVSSSAHLAGRVNFDNLQGRKRYIGWLAYAQSKLANVLFTYELARQLARTGVTANVLHPGIVRTNFALNNGLQGRLIRLVMDLVSIGQEAGAETVIYLAASPEVKDVTGSYFEYKKAVRSSSVSYNQALARRLWQVSLELTGLPAPLSH